MEEETGNKLSLSNLLNRLFEEENLDKLKKVPEFYLFVLCWFWVIWVLSWSGGDFNFDAEGFIVITAILLFLFFTGFILTASKKNNPEKERLFVTICRFILWTNVILAVAIKPLPIPFPEAVIELSDLAGRAAFIIIPLMSGVITGSKVKIFD